jgi:hypothetical protein
MPVTSSPVWNAAQAGLIGNATAMAASAQANQLLTTHPDTVIYQGNSILTPAGNGASTSAITLAAEDVDQPFTMNGAAIGRVMVPISPVGSGADLLVSLCSDHSGTPGTMISQTRIPASFITQLAATSGPSSASPLATPSGNALRYSGWQSIPWSPPATGATGGLSTAQMAQSGNFLVFAGGVNASNGNSTATVAVITYVGGTTVSAPVPGPQLPQPLLSGGFTVTPDTLCYVGGVNANGSSSVAQSTVYVASWSPTTGAIGTWSAQTALPHTLAFPGMAAYGPTDTVYVVGGSTNYAPATALTSTVYYSTVASQQITAWTAAQPIPAALADPSVVVIGNWLIVAGGYNASGNGNTSVYYAAINPSTGVPGPWLPGPSIPSGLYVEGVAAASATAVAWPQSFTPSTGIVAQDTLTLTWDADGPGIWTHQIGPIAVLNQDQVPALVPTDSGAYQIFNFQDFAYITAAVVPVPMISVPLPATGLSNGTTYHILLQQQGGDLNDYLTANVDVEVFTGNPTLMTSARDAYAWTAASSGTAVPIQIFDQTAPAAVGIMPWHTWEDQGARISTIVCATTPDQRLLGLCEATRMGLALNSNQGFETGVTPWAVTGGTCVQSTAESYSGLHSAQVTPSGSATQVYITSENLPCLPGQSITVAAWMWFTTAVTSQASVSVNWLSNTGAYLSTSSNSINVPATTWTELLNTFTAPAGAYQFTVNPILGGTPAASNIFYIDNAYATYTYTGPQQATVTAIEYPGSWPGTTWPPLGSTVLA